ncbi:hypothetical protein RAS12_22960 [Achromobacter seleniivolatilans]|uniref:Immunity protein CdiI n=1 Tax=Achromobacter seleniivolatilans TaxID=3047478 RepID=A0ABY9LXF9_9BURK|nr:hypothetical protein [Achromobacter sp. R39]WMD19454.1 hypothetical protein RAS12_22960 [Achromobacter sp. R39]
MFSRKELAEKYLAGLGATLDDVCTLDRFVELMEVLCSNNKSVFLFKLDGERTAKKYTFVMSFSEPGSSIIRIDTDEIADGVLYVLSRLEQLNFLQQQGFQSDK